MAKNGDYLKKPTVFTPSLIRLKRYWVRGVVGCQEKLGPEISIKEKLTIPTLNNPVTALKSIGAKVLQGPFYMKAENPPKGKKFERLWIDCKEGNSCANNMQFVEYVGKR